MSERDRVHNLISFFDKRYGYIDWWNAGFDEVAIGAILTQQTRWENVRTAVNKLADADLLTLQAICTADLEQIEACIRCTGFYRIKTARLRRLAGFINHTLGETIREMPTDDLREALLTINGVGEETADSILCYGLFRKTFVIDAYTRKICRCAGVDLPDRELRRIFLELLDHDNNRLRSCHGQIVEYAKEHCTAKKCTSCSIPALNG